MQNRPNTYNIGGIVAIIGLIVVIVGLIFMLALPGLDYAIWIILGLGAALLGLSLIHISEPTRPY